MPADPVPAAPVPAGPPADAPPDARPPALLEAGGVRRAFGGTVAVDVDEFRVPAGGIVALIGPNGAGKTTFFNILSGFERADAGRWTFAGRDLTGRPPHRVAAAGMVRTFQIPRVLARLTVRENLMLGAPHQRGERLLGALTGRWRAQERALSGHAAATAADIGLTAVLDDYAGTLSGGQRKLLELGRALMARPRLLMLDEPMAGVNPALAEQLLDRLLRIRSSGVTLLFVEHDMDVVTRISDEVVCMAEGRIIARGRAAEVAANEAVIDAYLGAHHERLGRYP
jgi:branched-chain amino acid transport system ATP-binding protein